MHVCIGSFLISSFDIFKVFIHILKSLGWRLSQQHRDCTTLTSGQILRSLVSYYWDNNVLIKHCHQVVTVLQVRIAVSSFYLFFSKRSALRTLFHNIVYHLHLKTDLSGKLWHFSTEWPLYPLQFLALPRLNFQPSLVMIDISAWIASELGLSFKQSWDGHQSELSAVLSSRSYPEVFIQNLHVRCFVTMFLIKAAYLVIILVQYTTCPTWCVILNLPVHISTSLIPALHFCCED